MKQRRIGYLGYAIVMAAYLWTMGGAVGQRLLVRTVSVTATGEATGSYLASVDLALGEALPTVETIPGTRPVGRLTLAPDASFVFASSAQSIWGAPETGHTLGFISVYAPCPFRGMGLVPAILEMGWEPMVGPILRDPATGALSLIILATKRGEDGTWQGRLHVAPLEEDRSGVPLGDTRTYPLPGAPVGAVGVPHTNQVAVLCRSSLGNGSYLHVINFADGEILFDAMEIAGLEARRLGSEPAALAICGEAGYLLALTTGYALDRPSGNTFTALHGWTLPDMQPIGEPLELPGAPERTAAPLQSAEGATWWVATHAPGEGFAYATRVAVSQDGLRKTGQPSFTKVSRPLLLAPAPTGPAVAIAVDHRLEVRENGQAEGPTHAYAAPLETLLWTSEGLFVGEGGRVHRVEPTSAAPLATVQLQTGLVDDLALLPADVLPAPDPDADGVATPDEASLGTNPLRNDTDGDGIHDGADPEPTTPSPRLELPSAVVFREEAAGQELRAVTVGATEQGSKWRSSYDQVEMPWLSVYPRGGTSPVFYLGVDPSRYEGSTEGASGTLTVHATGVAPTNQAYGSPARIGVWVCPKRSAVRRILWLLEGGDAQQALRGGLNSSGLGELVALLAAPPHYFSHHEAAESYLQSLDPYTVVVLTPEAALRGAVTRQAILDYVARGGGLLFLGSHLGEDSTQPLSRWLSPIGIHLSPAEQIEGKYTTSRSHWLSRFWDDFSIAGGCGVRVDDPDVIVVAGGPGSDVCILALQQYGYGRIAVAASQSVFEDAVMRQPSSRRFADALFAWLARSGRDVEDLDADALPDGVEDRNRNAARDPSETSALNPDSDGDGLPDGMEDMNRNGRVDPGETSPLNPDSDGDGIRDGADVAPLPSLEAPHVAMTEPSTGPAEGGTQVLISGRNLLQDSVVWFGARRSPRVRSLGVGALFAESPPCESEEGAPVDVRIETLSGSQEGLLLGGYVYTPLSEVNLTLERIRSAETTYQGMIAVRAECEPHVKLGWITLRIDAEPADRLTWGELSAGSAAELTGRQVMKRPTPTGGIWIDISPGTRDWRSRPRTLREMATIRWESSVPISPEDEIQLTIGRGRVMSTNGVPLRITVKGIPLEWEQPA